MVSSIYAVTNLCDTIVIFVALTDDSDKKTDENSNNAREMNDNSNDQKNNVNNEQRPSQSLMKQDNEETISNQNANEANAQQQLQYRPLNMFNSPPPGFIRPPPGPPPLLNPNFFPPPNRFWGNGPPGMNMNQNKAMQQSNRWSSPSNFDRQRFNRPPPDFGMESSRPNRRLNNDDDGDGSQVRDDEHNSKDDDNAGEDLDNFDDSPATNDNNDAEAGQPEQANSNQNNATPKRPNPFSQIPRIPPNEETDFVLNNAANKANNIGQAFRPGMPPADGSANNQQSPAFNRNMNNANQPFNNQNFNNPIGQFNTPPGGPQPLFSPQNMNFNSPMRGRGGIRNDSPYFRPRGRGSGLPGMNMNRGNFRPNFRGNNRGSW